MESDAVPHLGCGSVVSGVPMMATTYAEFLERKLHAGADHGFDPVFMPPQLFDFQQALVQKTGSNP